MLEAEKIKSNWERYRGLVNDFFPSRKDALNKMYDELEERMVFMPASSMEHFHNAFAGGYVDHVLRVMDCALTLHNTWTVMGADMSGYTEEELLFAAMHHDLGKAGFPIGIVKIKANFTKQMQLFHLLWYQIFQFGCFKNMMLKCLGLNIKPSRFMMECMMTQINHTLFPDLLKLN